MTRIFRLIAVLIIFAVNVASAEDIPLEFKQDGKDLIVTATVLETRGIFVIQTSSNRLNQQKTLLHYKIVYNANSMRQSVAPVKITWRLRNITREDGEYVVEQTAVVALSKEELATLTAKEDGNR